MSRCGSPSCVKDAATSLNSTRAASRSSTISAASPVDVLDEYRTDEETIYFRETKSVQLPLERETMEMEYEHEPPSLRLLTDELTVVHVRGIKYDLVERDVKYRADSKGDTSH